MNRISAISIVIFLVLFSASFVFAEFTQNCNYGNDIIEITSPDSLFVVDFGTPVAFDTSSSDMEFLLYPNKGDYQTSEVRNLELVSTSNDSVFKFKPTEELMEKRQYSLQIVGITIPRNDRESPVPLEECKFFYVYYGPLKITRISPILGYTDDSQVTLEYKTNRKSECRVSATSSKFDSMLVNLQSADQYIHTTNYPGTNDFNVVCKDIFNDTALLEDTLILDGTMPINLKIDDSSEFEAYPNRWNKLTSLRVKFSGEDPESQVKLVNYSIVQIDTNLGSETSTDGFSTNNNNNNNAVDDVGNIVLDWSTTDRLDQWILVSSSESGQSLNLKDGAQYKFVARFKNGAGMWSEKIESDGIRVDSWFDPSRVGPDLFCNNDVLDDGEIYIDCGGICDGCDIGHECSENTDCASRFCNPDTLSCALYSCNDTFINGDESDVDCGGSCDVLCSKDMVCNEDSDCTTNYCLNYVCSTPSCFDDAKNGDETDIDCGGSCIKTCNAGRSCESNFDCSSGICDEFSLKCEDKPPEPEKPDYTNVFIIIGVIIGILGLGGVGYYLYSSGIIKLKSTNVSPGISQVPSQAAGQTSQTTAPVQTQSTTPQNQVSSSITSQSQKQVSQGVSQQAQQMPQSQAPRPIFQAGIASKIKRDLQSKENRRKVDSLFGNFSTGSDTQDSINSTENQGDNESNISKKDIDGLFGGLEKKTDISELELKKSKK